MSSSNSLARNSPSEQVSKSASKKEAHTKPPLRKHSHPYNSWVKKPRVSHSYNSASRSVSQRKLSHAQMFQMLPIPHGQQRDHFESTVTAFCTDLSAKSGNQKSYEPQAPLYLSHLRKFDNKVISKTPVWVIAHGLEVISMGIDEYPNEELGIAGDHAFIIECVLNEHLKTDKPVSFVNKHKPKLEFVSARSKDTRHGSTKTHTVITYLPASNCFYSIFAPLPRPSTGYVPLPAEWLRLTRFGSRPGTPLRISGQPAKGAFIQEVKQVYRVYLNDKKKRQFIHGRHVDDYRIPLPPDWPLCPQVRKLWPTTKAERREEYYRRLITSTKNVALGKRYVPGVLYNNLPDGTKAYIIDSSCLKCNDEIVLRMVHSIDREGRVDYQSTLRVRRLDFRKHQDFECGLKLLTRHLKKGNINSASVRNGHGDGNGQMYPLGTHMHNGEYAVYAKTADVKRDVISALMTSYRKVLATHIPFDLHAIDGHAEYHGMRPIPLMGGKDGVTNSINVSRNLENPPHHDVGDLGNGTSVWVEDEPGMAIKWNFVCPNIIVKDPKSGRTYEGVIVKLCHGAMIDWDGLYTRHCTSMCERGGPKNNLWGVHLTNNHPSLKEFQCKLQHERMEIEVKEDEVKQRLIEHEEKKKFDTIGKQQQHDLSPRDHVRSDGVEYSSYGRAENSYRARQTSERTLHRGWYDRTDHPPDRPHDDRYFGVNDGGDAGYGSRDYSSHHKYDDNYHNNRHNRDYHY
jgi:hypothetical protein